MIEANTLKQAMGNWAVGEGYKITYCPPQAKFVTGNPKTDAQLHSFETDSGVEITLTTDFSDIAECNVIDEPKFMWFMLKWA